MHFVMSPDPISPWKEFLENLDSLLSEPVKPAAQSLNSSSAERIPSVFLFLFEKSGELALISRALPTSLPQKRHSVDGKCKARIT